MIIPKAAIEKALEGGWKRANYSPGWAPASMAANIVVYQVALDPSFWQALGKALKEGDLKETWPNGTTYYPWQRIALDFYDLILTGGDTEEFWEELLAKSAA